MRSGLPSLSRLSDPQPLRGELTTAHATRFVDSLAGFGMPLPIVVATGGDVLLRQDLDAMLERARALKVPVALAPSVTPLVLFAHRRCLTERIADDKLFRDGRLFAEPLT